jgi:hypothetical protein
VKVDIDVGGNPIKYDSTRAGENSISNLIGEFFKFVFISCLGDFNKPKSASNPMGEFFKAVVGAEFKLVLDARTIEMVRIEGHKEFVNKLGAANKQMKPLLDKVLGEDALKEMAQTYFASQLMGPARPGDSWNKRRQMDMGPLGTYQIASRYTYAGKECELDRIKVESSLKYGLPAPQEGVGGVPFRIEKAALGGKETGALFFDRARGRVARAESNQKMNGKLTVLIGGQKTIVELSQTQQTMVQTSDVSPLRAGLRDEESKELQRLRDENERLRRRLQAVEVALRRDDKSK